MQEKVLTITILVIVSSCLILHGYCDVIDVNLIPYQPGDKQNVYKQYTTLSEDTTKVKIYNINSQVGFFIIQVHSFIENITLSYNSSAWLYSSVTGTNVGLFNAHDSLTTTFYIFRNMEIKKEVPILLLITLYGYLDPIPGGCNLSFDTKVAPYQLVSYNDHYVEVESQPSSVLFGAACDDDKVEVDMYHLFLTEYDNDIRSYFDGIEKMATVDSIRKFGRKVRSGEKYFKYRRLYSLYKGTGEVFAIIATYENKSSAYVPAVTYGCDLLAWKDCVAPIADYWKFICASLLICGLLTCFLGHKFFRFTLFVVGFTFGILITYLVISFDGHFGLDEKIVTSVITGFFYGVIWVFIWWKYGIPFLSAHLNFILGGFLFASIVFYAGLADVGVFTNSVNFWVTFACLIVACIIVWAPATMHGHIFCCSFLGSYACIVALSYYLGGSLQYIILNSFRRATVNNFNEAVIDPPFQIADILHSLLWVFMIITGCYVQLRDQRGKPPFPPNRNGVASASRATERTPLIAQEDAPVEPDIDIY